MENKFKKGLILGGLLAAAATIGLVMSEPGQELTEELQKDLKTLVKKLKKNLHKLEDVTKDHFDKLVSEIVEEYAQKKELAGEIKDAFISALQSKWSEMEKEYLDEKDGE